MAIPIYGFQWEKGTIISSKIKFDPTVTLSGFLGTMNAFGTTKTATKLETYLGFKVHTKHYYDSLLLNIEVGH